MNNNELQPTQNARYNRPDGTAAVIGRWHHRGGCLWLGEVRVVTANSILYFSSTTPRTSEGLADYATDDYLIRHAAKFMAR